MDKVLGVIYQQVQTAGFFFFPGGFKVFFVALVQSFSHYNNVAQKLVGIILFFYKYFFINKFSFFVRI